MRQVITNGMLGRDNSHQADYNTTTWQGRKALDRMARDLLTMWQVQSVEVQYYNGSITHGVQPYRVVHFNGSKPLIPRRALIRLRKALETESISYAELAEIASLAELANIHVTEEMLPIDVLDEIEATQL